MGYQKPFTPVQRREAVQAYKSYRKHRSRLRRDFPPTNDLHRDVLEAYGDAIEAMRHELRKRDRNVDVNALNRAAAAARWHALDYWKLHYPQE